VDCFSPGSVIYRCA